MSKQSKQQLKIRYEDKINLMQQKLKSIHPSSSKITNVNRLIVEYANIINQIPNSESEKKEVESQYNEKKREFEEKLSNIKL